MEDNCINYRIQVTMFDFQLDDATLNKFRNWCSHVVAPKKIANPCSTREGMASLLYRSINALLIRYA